MVVSCARGVRLTKESCARGVENGVLTVCGIDVSGLDKRLQGAFLKLKDYEDTGFTAADFKMVAQLHDAVVEENDRLREQLRIAEAKGFPASAACWERGEANGVYGVWQSKTELTKFDAT